MYISSNLTEMEVLVIDYTKENFEYPSPTPLKGKAARYIKWLFSSFRQYNPIGN